MWEKSSSLWASQQPHVATSVALPPPPGPRAGRCSFFAHALLPFVAVESGALVEGQGQQPGVRVHRHEPYPILALHAISCEIDAQCWLRRLTVGLGEGGITTSMTYRMRCTAVPEGAKTPAAQVARKQQPSYSSTTDAQCIPSREGGHLFVTVLKPLPNQPISRWHLLGRQVYSPRPVGVAIQAEVFPCRIARLEELVDAAGRGQNGAVEMGVDWCIAPRKATSDPCRTTNSLLRQGAQDGLAPAHVVLEDLARRPHRAHEVSAQQ